MRQLILCSEFPPAPTPPGGIGTYVHHISRLLAEAGEVVHVIAPLWHGAPDEVTELCDGRLVVHRVPLDRPLSIAGAGAGRVPSAEELRWLARSAYPPQAFSLQAGALAEILIQQEGIDLVESQEWQAPLYHFLLRRGLGLGPKRTPPCMIFMHSPTEFILRHNEWDITDTYALLAKRMEDYCIGAADSLVCPSHYLARQAERHYGLESDRLQVLRLPVGDMLRIERDEQTWEHGTILSVGRLEPRKGVIEWVEAAISVADRFPETRFEFVGANLPYASGLSVREFVQRSIPDRLKSRFQFYGSRNRAELSKFLARARVAVIPSRWENFPNTCVEAMASGVPVLASPNGGMAEMIDDGTTGWIAEGGDPASLAKALERALETPARQLAGMGRAASASIDLLCNNARIVEEHMAVRERIARLDVRRSTSIPANLPWAGQPLEAEPKRPLVDPGGDGIAVVITALNGSEEGLEECMSSVAQQTQPPAVVTLVVPAEGGSTRAFAQRARDLGWTICELGNAATAEARNVAMQRLRVDGIRQLALLFLDHADRLEPAFLDICGRVLRDRPEVGVVSCWTRVSGHQQRLVTGLCPAFPYQLLTDDTTPASMFRREAIEQAGGFRSFEAAVYERHDLVNAVMAAGWAAVTVPEVLSERPAGSESRSPAAMPGHQEARRRMYARVPGALARDASALALLLESRVRTLQRDAEVLAGGRQKRQSLLRYVLRLPLREKFHLVRRTARKAPAALRFLVTRLQRRVATRL